MIGRPAWARDPEVLERLFLDVLATGDAAGVAAVLRLMVVADPARAVRLYDELRFSLALAERLAQSGG